MTSVDIEKARRNRERQRIIYPDTCEETEESKQQGRDFLRAITSKQKRRVKEVKIKVKQVPVSDPITMKIKWY